jgi:hypothetical protein
MIGALCAAAAVLLLWSGLAKLARPTGTARMLSRLLGPRAGRRTVARLIGLVEAAVGGAGLLIGSRSTFVALAVCYLVFTIVAVRLLRSGRPSPCGCFGAEDAPTGRSHVVVDTVAWVAATAGAWWPPGPWGGLARGDALLTMVGLGQVVLLAAMAYLLVTVLPSVLTERDRMVSAS